MVRGIKMNPINVSLDMVDLIRNSKLPEYHPEYGKDHLLEMVTKIVNGSIYGNKAHRWLGWIQGCVCMGKGSTLEQMKYINKEA